MFGYFEDRNYVYLVLELCHNGELQQYLKKMHCGMSEEEGKHSVINNLHFTTLTKCSNCNFESA